MIAACQRTHRISVFAFVLFCATLAACAIWKPIAKAVIDVSIAVCIEEHPDINTEPELATVCKYDAEFGPIVSDLLSARARGRARAAAEQKAKPDATVILLISDAGAKDAK